MTLGSTSTRQVTFTADEATAAELSQALVEAGALIKVLTPQTVTLEDLFFSFTEGDGREPEPPRREPAPATQS